MRTGTKQSATNWLKAERWTAADARMAVEALRESGEPVTRFAARHGIAAHRLYDWRRRLAGSMAVAATFVEVTTLRSASRAEVAIEITLVTGDVVRVPEGVEGSSLRVVIEALRATERC